MNHKSFENSDALCEWLKEHHDTKTELWVRIFKKVSGHQTVSWNDCVVAALAWGWIDGQKKSHDDLSYLQRLTPRRPKSNWSKRNKDHANRLIDEHRMHPSGLLQVNKAKKDGRWDAAYEGSANMKIPREFLDILKTHKKAEIYFKKLDRRNLYSIYLQLTTAKKPETRARRIQNIIAQLSNEERFS